MHVLVIKTSSLGDVIHTLPALTDASQHDPQLQCDWVVEQAFADIPSWHPAVRKVIPVALRRWRKQIWQTWSTGTWQQFKRTLTEHHYDLIIDAQGLIKSAWLTYQVRGIRCGFDRYSIREPLATLAYQRQYSIAQGHHAITRLRQLFAAILNYPLPSTPPDYGIASHFPRSPSKNIIFLYGTTWPSKRWPAPYWKELAQRLTNQGYTLRLPWGNDAEYRFAQQLVALHPNIHLIPQGNLQQLAQELSQACLVVGVDTGLAHLAAALAIPSVSLYGATHPTLTGTCGKQQVHLLAQFPCAPCLKRRCIYQGETSVIPPCYELLSVEKVYEKVQCFLD